MSTVIVIAKAPVPGRVKTRLCPPCSPAEAAQIAEAALADTLEAVEGSGAERRVLAIEGRFEREGWELVPQRGNGLEERLAHAFEDAGTPSVLIGMDTPQVSAVDIDHALGHLRKPEVDVVIGATLDGGYWIVGLARRTNGLFDDIPMSTSSTFAAQWRRIEEMGLRSVLLPPLQDVDTFDDALQVAEKIPASRFTRAVSGVASESTHI